MPYANAELVIQFNYNSHQIVQDGQPTMLIDPNLTIIVGNQFIERETTQYFQYLNSTLSCEYSLLGATIFGKKRLSGPQLNNQSNGASFYSDTYHQSDVHSIDHKTIWPNDMWYWLRSDSVNCQYSWQYRLYRASNLQPLLALGDEDFMKKTYPQKPQHNTPLHSNFTLTHKPQ